MIAPGHSPLLSRLWTGLQIGLISALVCACANTPELPRHNAAPPVYPPPPDEPRFVFERTLLYNDDVEEYSDYDRLRTFALGSSRKLKGLVKPYDVAVRRGRVYVTDSVQRAVFIFDIPGRRFLEFGSRKPGQLSKPMGIAIAANGDVYVADISARRVMVYTSSGQFKHAIGDKTTLVRPADVALSPDGQRVYVVDTGGIDSLAHHVQVYDTSDGQLLQTIGSRGTGPGQFNLPLQATVAPDGRLYVVDGGNFQVDVFTADGQYLRSIGSIGRMPGQFSRPKGIASDRAGNIYVVDTAFGNTQIFDPDGRLLMFMGQRGEAGLPGKFMLPSGIAIDEDGRIYMTDQFFRKVDVFRPYALAETEGFAAYIFKGNPP